MSWKEALVGQRLLISLLLGLSLTGPTLASPTALQEPDAMTKQAIKLYSLGRVQEAIDAEDEAINHDAKDWLPHAMRSYFLWQQGSSFDSITEGEKAVELSGNNTIVVTNLASMHLVLGAYPDAIKLFEGAIAQAPDEWQPRLGLARCYLTQGLTDQGLGVLSQMTSEDGKSFAWYYQLASLYLDLQKPDLAELAAVKAAKAATTRRDKSASDAQLALVLLRNNKIQQAQVFKTQLLSDSQLCDPELIARTASQLISASEPLAGKKLFSLLQTNLKSSSESDVFYRLGRIFEEKAAGLSQGNIKIAEWQALAEKSYKQAIALNDQFAYHTALAGALYSESKVSEAIEELNRARGMDRSNTFLGVLVDSLQPPTAQSPGKTLNLTEVRFAYNGTGCGCKLSLVALALKSIDGVAFAATKGNNGGILADISVTPVAEIFARAAREFPKSGKNPALLKFEVTSQKSVANVHEALTIAKTMAEESPVTFYHELKPVLPVMPLEALATVQDKTRVGSKSATTP